MPTENRYSHKCPKCGSDSIRRSTQNLLDRVRTVAGYSVYRCRDCRRRFHRLAPPAAPQSNTDTRRESRKRRRALRLREFCVYAAALAAFTAVAFVITLERG